MAPRGRSPRVDIKSSSQVPRTAKESEAALARLQSKSKEGFGHLAKHALGYGAALVGGAGVVGGLEAVVEKGIEAQASQVKVQKAVDNAGLSWSKYKDQIDKAIERQAELGGFAKTDLQDAFANMVRTTGNVTKALHLNNLAMDIARTKGTSLQAAQSLLARVYNGSFLGLKKLGIAIEPVTTAQDKLKATTKHATDEQKRAAKELDKTATSHKALALVQQKFGGQAKAFGQTTAGALARMRESVDLLEVKLGTALLPTITKVADKAAKFINQMRDGTGAGGRFADKMGQVAHDVGRVLGVVKDVAGWLGKHPALLKAAGAAWVAYKTAALANIAIVKAAELGLFGAGMKAKLAGEAAGTGGAVGSAFAAKAGLVAAAAIGGWEIGKWLRKNVGPVRDAGNWLGTQLGQAIFGGAFQDQLDNSLAEAVKRAGNALGPIGTSPNAVKPFKQNLLPKTGRGKGGPQGTGHTSPGGHHRVGKSSVRAGAASSSSAGVRAHASGGSVSGDTAGLNADFLGRLQAMAAGTGHAIFVKSGFRTAAEQEALVREKGVWSPSNPTGAAPVGSSMHEKGLAADISPDRGTFGGVCAKYGLVFPIAAEPWHCQPSGTASSAPSNSSAPAASSGPTKAQLHAAAEKARKRRDNKAFTRFVKSLAPQLGRAGAAGAVAGRAGTRADDLETRFGLRQRRDDLETEDLTTDAGRQARAAEIGGETAIKQSELDELRKERTALRKQATALKKAIAKVKKKIKAKSTPDSQKPRLRKLLKDYVGRYNQVRADLKALGVSIESVSIDIAELDNAQAEASTPPDDSGSAPSAYDTVEGQIGDIGLHEHAGDYGSDPGAAHTTALNNDIAAIDAALANPAGLSDEDILQLRAQRGDLVAELKDLTDNTANLAAQMKDLTDAINTQNQFAQSVSAVSLGTVWKALADVISGQIFGSAYGRAQTAGAGDITRY